MKVPEEGDDGGTVVGSVEEVQLEARVPFLVGERPHEGVASVSGVEGCRSVVDEPLTDRRRHVKAVARAHVVRVARVVPEDTAPVRVRRIHRAPVERHGQRGEIVDVRADHARTVLGRNAGQENGGEHRQGGEH